MNTRKKVQSFIFLAVVVLLVFLSYKVQEKCKPPTLDANSKEYLLCPYQKIQLHKEVKKEEVKTESENEIDIYEVKCNELLEEQKRLNTIHDKKEWFLAYKEIIQEYSDYCDAPETIYDYYNDYLHNEDELQLLFQVVEAEATSGDFIAKCNVASTIINRVNNEQFGETLGDVLNEDQFSSISDGRYKKVEVTEDTILACEYVFMIQDTTNGALYFESGDNNIHSNYADFQFKDSVGHKFYTEK